MAERPLTALDRAVFRRVAPGLRPHSCGMVIIRRGFFRQGPVGWRCAAAERPPKRP